MWLYAFGTTDLGAEWGIDSSSISQLAGTATREPPAHLAAKYEVEQLQVRNLEDHLRGLNEASRDQAFQARLDAV